MPKRPSTAPDPSPRLRVVKQRHSSDCAVATLAMFLGVRYEDVLVAFNKPVIDIGVDFPKDMIAVARKLKTPLKLRKRFDHEVDDGILHVDLRAQSQAHVVVLMDGLVFDTDGAVWDYDDYLIAANAKPMGLLMRHTEIRA